MSQPQREVPLSILLDALPDLNPASYPDTPITGIALDSRRLQPGNLFVALAGGSTDGHRFIPAAIQRGAAAIVGTEPRQDLPVPYIQVSESRRALGLLSAAFYDFPARKLTVIGVTGTDGKTTTSTLIYKILLAAGKNAGMISTVHALIGEEILDTGFHVTTPEAPDVQAYLARMVAQGLTHVVLEATSHGLEQQRVLGCDFDLAVITNITHEHLDYHRSYEAYRAAKARLFTSLSQTPAKLHGSPRAAILNRDDSSYDYLRSLIQSQNAALPSGCMHPQNLQSPISIFTYGLHPESTLRAEDIAYTPSGLRFVATGPHLRILVESRLVGEFNVSNCLAAAAATVLGLQVEERAVAEGIRSLEGIPGRMERIDLGQDFLAIIDFAHTPNALERSLRSARLMTSGRVIAVFGSAGLRDRLKRRMMAEVSVGLADLTILTAEDPRTESLEDILSEMALGAQAEGGVEGRTFFRIPDRREALRFAVSQAAPGDIVMALGKGHEQSMCFGEQEVPWDDGTAMRAALAERLGVPGPEMPSLPTSLKY